MLVLVLVLCAILALCVGARARVGRASGRVRPDDTPRHDTTRRRSLARPLLYTTLHCIRLLSGRDCRTFLALPRARCSISFTFDIRVGHSHSHSRSNSRSCACACACDLTSAVPFILALALTSGNHSTPLQSSPLESSPLSLRFALHCIICSSWLFATGPEQSRANVCTRIEIESNGTRAALLQLEALYPIRNPIQIRMLYS